MVQEIRDRKEVKQMGKMVTCARCKGKGSIKVSAGMFSGMKEVKCPVCGGSGKVEQK